MRIRRFGVRTVGLLLILYFIWCPPQATVEGEEVIDRVAIIAVALDVDPDRVTVEDSRPTDGGKRQRVVLILEDADTDANRIVVEYEPDTGLLRRIAWVGRAVAGQSAVSQDEALEQAQRLVTRLFPAIPYDMKLVEAMPHGSLVTRDGVVVSPLLYSFLWRAEGPGGARTGDTAGVRISVATGEPLSYTQRVAPKRPDLEDIQISQERAVEVAIEQTKLDWRELRGMEVTVEATRANLVLSSSVSPEEGPVWFVNVGVGHATTGERLEQTQRVTDAYSGEILR